VNPSLQQLAHGDDRHLSVLLVSLVGVLAPYAGRCGPGAGTRDDRRRRPGGRGRRAKSTAGGGCRHTVYAPYRTCADHPWYPGGAVVGRPSPGVRPRRSSGRRPAAHPPLSGHPGRRTATRVAVRHAASPAAPSSTSATDKYAAGGRSHAWALFGPAARTAPVATAYSPMASRGSARIRHTDATMADGTPSVTLSINNRSGGISSSAAAAPRMAMAAGRRLR